MDFSRGQIIQKQKTVRVILSATHCLLNANPPLKFPEQFHMIQKLKPGNRTSYKILKLSNRIRYVRMQVWTTRTLCAKSCQWQGHKSVYFSYNSLEKW